LRDGKPTIQAAQKTQFISIQVLLGHSRPETTARCAHLTEANRDQAKARIEELLGGFQLRWEES
jgi:hypothetical protein